MPLPTLAEGGPGDECVIQAGARNLVVPRINTSNPHTYTITWNAASHEYADECPGFYGEYRLKESKDGGPWTTIYTVPENTSFNMAKTLSNKSVGTYRYFVDHCDNDGYCDSVAGANPISVYDLPGIAAPITALSTASSAAQPYTISASYTGSSAINLPLQVAPGVNGLEPALSLNYSSGSYRFNRERQTPAGILSYGWSLAGLSKIHRCSTGKDSGYQILFLNDDQLCLDGEPLVKVSAANSEYPHEWEYGDIYRTQRDRFARVKHTRIGSNAPSPYGYFEVTQPNGTVMVFGETVDSRSDLTWHLTKVTDAFGNTMRISYYDDNIAHVNYPKQILYGNNGDARIDFSYVARDDAQPLSIGDWEQRYSVQLQQVKIYTDNKLQREYRLVPETTSEGWVRLDKIQQCAYNESGSGRQCMAPLDISWEVTDSANPEEVLMAVSKVHDGLKETRFSYATITSASSAGTFAERPFGEGSPPGGSKEQPPVSGEYRYALTEIDRDDGIGGRHKTGYAYQGVGLMSTQNRGFLGFYAQREIDEQSGIVTYRQFRQVFPHFTKLARLQQYDGIYGGSEILTDKQYRYGRISLYYDVGYEFGTYTHVPMLTESLSINYEQGAALGGDYTQVQYTQSNNLLTQRIVTTKAATSVTPGSKGSRWGEYEAPYVGGVLRSRQTIEDFTNRTSGQWLLQFVNRRTQKFYDGDTGTSADRTSVVTYTPHDSSNKVASEVRQPGNADYQLTSSYSYNSQGNQTAETASGVGVSSRTTSITSYSDKRYPASLSNPMGHSVSTVYDARFGLPKQVTDANDRITSIAYDNFGREISRTTPDSVTFSTSYDRCGGAVSCPTLAKTRISTSAPITPTTTRYFDALGRVLRSERAPFSGIDNIVEEIVYDSQGRVEKASNPYFDGDAVNYTQYEYDLRQRVTKTIRPDGSYTKAIYGEDATYSLASVQTQDHVYSDDGSFVETQKKLSYYNMAGDLTKTYDGYGSSEQVVTEYRYHSSGQMDWTRVNADNNRVTTISYDAATGFRDSITGPTIGTVSYTYNALGQKTSQTDNLGQTISYDYDKLGRLTTQTDPNSTASWVYDPANAIGALASRSYPGFSESYSYNTSTHVTDIDTEINVTSGGQAFNRSYNHSYSYDNYGRVGTLTYPTGIRVGYQYTGNGYLQQLVDDRDGQVLKSFASLSAFGAVEQESYGNGLVINHTYNPLTGHLESIDTGNGQVQDSEYKWRSNGTLESRLSRADGSTKVESFTYDALNRLGTATTTVNGGSSRALTTLYDKLGNITSRTSSHASDSAATAVLGGASTLSYDANGAVTRYDAASGDDRWITWNARQLAEEITLGSSKTTATPTARDRFRYGPDGQRFFREATWMEGGTLRTERTFYLGSFEELLPANDPDYSSIATAKVDANVVHIKATETLGPQVEFMEYLHRDHLGSIEKITDETGAVILNTPFDPFGTRRAKDWKTQIQPAEMDDLFASQNLTTRRGFTGHEHLDRIGLIHMNGRVYDPILGRFISPDPLVQAPTNSQNWNRYSYVFNSPLSFTDPSGYVTVVTTVTTCSGQVRSDGSTYGEDCESKPVVKYLTEFAFCVTSGDPFFCELMHAGNKQDQIDTERAWVEAAHYAQEGNKDDSDLKFTYGLQAGAKVGLTKLLGAKIDLDVASKEISLITGKEYANQNFAISVDIAGFSLGLDASRNQEFSTFVYGKDSVMSILSGKPFEFKPVFSTPWNVSSKEFWKLEFGASAVLGLEGTLDFE